MDDLNEDHPQYDTDSRIASPAPRPLLHEDYLAVACGVLLLVAAFGAVWIARPSELEEQVRTGAKIKPPNPLASYLAKPGSWTENPRDAFYRAAEDNKPAFNAL